MNLHRYLIDTSALVRLLREPAARAAWEQQVTAGTLAVCPLTELELLYSARSKAHREELLTLLRASFGWVVMPERVYDLAAEVQAALTARGTHRSAGAVDLLVAATAQVHGLVLLHYDNDFPAIAEVTGQPVRWLADPGTLP